jgi:hypothetical protein
VPEFESLMNRTQYGVPYEPGRLLSVATAGGVRQRFPGQARRASAAATDAHLCLRHNTESQTHQSMDHNITLLLVSHRILIPRHV